MIFPQYDYKNFHNENKEEWPNGTTIEDWCKMVNDAYKYCQELEDYMEFEGKCNYWDLPSFHPYWRVQTILDDEKTLARHLRNYEKCLEEPENVIYLYNASMTFEKLENMIIKRGLELNKMKEKYKL